MNPVEQNNNETNNGQPTNGPFRNIRASGQQMLPPHLRQPPQGLADWFVAKHTTDETLRQQLLSKYGFTQLTNPTENNNQQVTRQQVNSLTHICAYCGRIPSLSFGQANFSSTRFSMNPVQQNKNTMNNGQPTNGAIRNIRASGQQILPPYLRQPPKGLADWFVAKHTTDKTLRQQLLSKYGFTAPNHEFPQNYQFTNQTENNNPSVNRQQANSSTHICAYCGRIPPL